MKINGLNFNETELDLFRRKTGFIFGECIPVEDGMFYAMDEQSGQVFIGNDLITCNVHSCSSITAVSLESDGEVCLEFKDAPAIRFRVKGDSAKADAADIGARLSGYTNSHDEDIPEETAAPARESSPEQASEQGTPSKSDDSEHEQAIERLTSIYGMSVKEAIDNLDEQEMQTISEADKSHQIVKTDAAMTKRDILDVVKSLKTGDMIHIEYKPLIGKKRMYDTEFRGMTAEVTSRYFSLHSSGGGYASMMDKVFMELYDNLNLCILCPDNNSEIEWRLKRIMVLRKM